MVKKIRHKSSGSTAVKKTAGRKKTLARKKARATPIKKKAVTAKKTTLARKKAAPGRKKAVPVTKKARSAGARMMVHRDEAALSGIKPYKKRQGEEYMGRKQIDHFRNILIRWKESLMQEVDRTVNHMQAGSSNHADSADRATQEEGFSLELRERDRERKLIRKIDQALGRLDNKEYGYCKLCGVEIGIRRLEARPTATMCIDCKTFDEIREKLITSA